jgi:F-type H+-transporting ATPase subunit gamma
MATLRDIKRKIGSINSTQTITRTMKMVSASKLRRAQEELEKFRGYAVGTEELVQRVIRGVPVDVHPLLKPKEEVKKILIFAVASDRGLCGAFNMNVALHAENFIIQNRDKYERISVAVFGRKLKDYLSRRRVDIVNEWVDVRTVNEPLVRDMASMLIKAYLEEEYDRIYLAYTHFKSPIKQEVIFDEFIPVASAEEGEYIDYLCEPERAQIIERLIPRYIGIKIYLALVESQTSEHAARMSTMENATSNCGEMMRYLTLVYNKRRQETITNEMMDIVGGAEALRGS